MATETVNLDHLNGFLDHLEGLHTEPRGHRAQRGRAIELYLSEWESGYDCERSILFDLMSVADPEEVYQFLQGHGFDPYTFFPEPEPEDEEVACGESDAEETMSEEAAPGEATPAVADDDSEAVAEDVATAAVEGAVTEVAEEAPAVAPEEAAGCVIA